jgi:lysophospholipid acyltransferase (LPLAT)-like uncharacterized protein
MAEVRPTRRGPSARRRAGGLRTLRRRAALAAVPAAAWLSRLLVATLRVRRDESAAAALVERGAPMILAMWHSRILVLPVVYGRHIPMRALVSRSLDGEMTARYLGQLGIGTVRGSSGQSGAAGLRALARALAEGVSVIVVPDGPRGPREVLKPGVIALARWTGVPIVPVAVGAVHEWRLRSWDGFRIPKPFSPCLVRAGAPIVVAPATDDGGGEMAGADLENQRAEVERALRALTSQVDEEVRR